MADGWHSFGENDEREPRVLVEVMGTLKGKDGGIMHLITLVNVIPSGNSICMWLDILVALLKEKGKTNLPDFCDMKGYMLSAAAIDIMFHLILEEIQIHRYKNLLDSIPRCLNVQEQYRFNRSFCRGAYNQVMENGAKENLINFSIGGRSTN